MGLFWIRTGWVAPLAGAWIEIVNQILLSFRKGSLPLRERGLKFAHMREEVTEWGRSPCGSVD